MRKIIWGLVLLLTCTGFLTGCENVEGEKVKNIGTKIGETVSNFFSGVGKGIKNEINVEVELAQEIAEQGLTITSTKVEGKKNEDKNLSVYFISGNSFQGNLLAKALDQEGEEIGRATVSVHFAKDDAQYVVFGFPKEMELALVQKYTIELKK